MVENNNLTPEEQEQLEAEDLTFKELGIPETDLFRQVGTVCKNAPPLEPLWGFLLFKKAITGVIGDPGVGKTTLIYSLVRDLCQGKSFLDITAEEPVRALMMDYESSDALINARVNLLFPDTELPNFYIYNNADIDLKQMVQTLVRYCQKEKINLIVIDNQSMAFNTRDENDNAEAIKQMKVIRALANATNASVILVHHASKANAPGTRKGSGAYARVRLADIIINLTIVDVDNPDTFIFETAKNRMVDERIVWYIKKSEGKFLNIPQPLVDSMQARGDTVIYKVQRSIIELFGTNGSIEAKEFKRQELIDMLKNTYSERQVQVGIDKLKQLGRLESKNYGYYRIRRLPHSQGK